MDVCRQWGTLSFFGQNVAVDGGQRFAWHRIGGDYSVVHRSGFTLFHGEYRVKQFGYSSAITNVTLVVATAVTGYLAEVNWHLPFVVYLLPLVSLLLVGYLKGDTGQPQKTEDTATVVPEESKRAIPGKYGIHVRHLLQLMLFYGVTTYVVLAVTFDLPFFDGGPSLLQRKFRIDDLLILPCHYGSGFLPGAYREVDGETHKVLQPFVHCSGFAF